MRREQLTAIADGMIDALAPTFDSFAQRIKALEEEENITVIPVVDPHRQYEDGAFGVIKNGLWRYSSKTGAWRCLSNQIADVKVEEAASGALTFLFEMSNGEVMRSVAKNPQPRSRPRSLCHWLSAPSRSNWLLSLVMT